MSQQQRNTTLVNKGDYVPGVEDISHKAAKRMDEQAQRTDSKAVQHTADLMKAQNELMVEKDLAERFRRISALLKKVKTRSPRDYDVMQKQVNSLKPLLRLSIESSEFRSSITKLIKTMELVFERKDKTGSTKDKLKRNSSKKSHKKSASKEKLRDTHFVEETVYVNQPVGTLANETVLPMPVATETFIATEAAPMAARSESWIPNEASGLPAPIPLQGLSGAPMTSGGMAGQMGIGGVGQQVWGTSEGLSVPMTTGVVTQTHTSHSTTETWNSGMGVAPVGGYHTLTDKEWKKIEDGLDEFFTLVNQHPQYRKGVNNIFDLMSTFSAEIPNSRDTTVVNELKMETRDLMAQFAGEDVLQRLFDNMEDLANMLDDNDEAQEWWDEFVTHFRKLCKNYSGRSDLRTARHHFDKADRIFFHEKKKIDKILHLANDVFENLKNDEYVRGLKKKMSVLADDMYYTDNEGKKHFDLTAVRDIAGAITDVLKEELKSVSIPDIEGSDKRGTYAIRNLRVKSRFPAKIKFRLDSELVDHTSRKSGKTAYRMNFVLRVGIQHVESWAKNIDFAFHMKGIKESGIMDVHVPSASLFIDFIFRPHKNTGALNDQTSLADPKTGEYKFVAVQSYFRIPDLVINYHKETLSHSFLVPLATKLYKRTLIKNLEAQVEKNINMRGEAMGSQLATTMNRSPMPISFGSGEKHTKYEKHSSKKRTTSGSKHVEETTVKKEKIRAQ